MTPLRVGPLTLRFEPDMLLWGYRRGPGYVIRLANRHALIVRPAGPLHWCAEISTDIHREVYLDTPELCASRLREYLTSTAYLTQYRSRRRLLARECEYRAQEHRAKSAAFWSPQSQSRSDWWEQGVRHQEHADKLDRWATLLRTNTAHP